MERRTFVKGAFGLVAFAALAGAGVAAGGAAGDGGDAVSCVGPAVRDDIALVADGDVVRGESGGVHLFNVDAIGADLMGLADGTRTIDELAASVASNPAPADVASFFVTLGQAGYLAHPVYVNLTETYA